MTTTPMPKAAIRSHDSLSFAIAWLRRAPETAIRTVPVIAVVQELLDVLRDQDMPAPQAYTALRRAVRLLSVFVIDAGRRPGHPETEQFYERDWVPSPDDVTGSAESSRFATEWLRGSPHATIRTEPVVAVVQELLDTLLSPGVPTREAHTALLRAVRLLSALTPANEHPQPTT